MSDWTPEKAERSRELRRERLADGFCQECGKRPPRPGRKTCQQCADKLNAKRSPEQAERASERAKRRLKEREAAGVCVQCGKKPPEPGKKRCADCLAKGRRRSEKYQRESAARRQEIREKTEAHTGKPLCSQCLRPAMPGQKLYEYHYHNFIEKSAATKAKNGTADQSGHAWKKDNTFVFPRTANKPPTPTPEPVKPEPQTEPPKAAPVPMEPPEKMRIHVRGNAAEIAALLTELYKRQGVELVIEITGQGATE